MGLGSVFQKIADSNASGSGHNFKPGGYELIVKKMFIHEGFNGLFFISEHLIDKSWPVDPNDSPRASGTSVSFCSTLGNPKAKGSDFAEVKRYVLALLGYDENQVTNEQFAATMEELVGKEPRKDAKGNVIPAGEKVQAMRGKRIKTECWTKPQKGDPTKGFTRHAWEHVHQKPEDIAAARMALDKTGA